MGFTDRISGNVDFEMIDKVLIVIGGLSLVMPGLKSFVFRPMSNLVLGPPIGKETKKAKELEAEREKFVNCAWKLLSYVLFFSFGVWAIQPELYWFWQPFTYHLPYPDSGRVPPRILNFYALETGYYIFSTFALFLEPKMKDRTQMFVHHLFTSFLLVSSYVGNTTKFGVPIMLLHDIADPPLEFAKMCVYAKFETLANIAFVGFAAAFVFFRDYVFPRHIIYPILVLTTEHHYKYAVPTVASLVGLWMLHLVWTYMIYQVIEKNIMHGKMEDVRDE